VLRDMVEISDKIFIQQWIWWVWWDFNKRRL